LVVAEMICDERMQQLVRTQREKFDTDAPVDEKVAVLREIEARQKELKAE
jgi:hypothetical protein